MSKSNSRYNGMTIEQINKFAKSPFTKVATVNGRDYWDSEKREGYYRAVLITNADGIVKQGFWFTTSEDVQAMIDRMAARKEARQTARKEMLASDSGVKVGDIFMTNWGYDETHIDYAVVRKISGRRAVFEDLTGTPGFEKVGDKRTKLIQGTGDNAYISLTSYANAYKVESAEYAQRRREQDDVAYTGHYR